MPISYRTFLHQKVRQPGEGACQLCNGSRKDKINSKRHAVIRMSDTVILKKYQQVLPKRPRMDRRSEKQQYKVNSCLSTCANDQRRIDSQTDKTTFNCLETCKRPRTDRQTYTVQEHLKNKPKDRLTDRQDGINMCKRPRTADLTDTQIV